jgi:hypothetical protein
MYINVEKIRNLKMKEAIGQNVKKVDQNDATNQIWHIKYIHTME